MFFNEFKQDYEKSGGSLIEFEKIITDINKIKIDAATKRTRLKFFYEKNEMPLKIQKATSKLLILINSQSKEFYEDCITKEMEKIIVNKNNELMTEIKKHVYFLEVKIKNTSEYLLIAHMTKGADRTYEINSDKLIEITNLTKTDITNQDLKIIQEIRSIL